MLEHGGQLYAAAQRYGIPAGEWLDLSTGINPLAFEPPLVPQAAWQRLPQDQDGLLQAAENYYGTSNLLPIAGSQAAIQLLPRLRGRCRAGILHPAYAEHAHAWRSAGHEIINLTPATIDTAIAHIDVLVLLQPNNPTGEVFDPVQLHDWHARLHARNGWLIVDEAFVEACTRNSMVQKDMPPGLLVLRSLGKFFGLAGARVGFAFAQAELLARMQNLLGPWSVSGPSRFVAQAALSDRAWQAATSARLQQDAARLAQLLQHAKLIPDGGCGLFQWVKTARAETVHHQLAQRGILTRLFTQPISLRFGLPGSEAEWTRLQSALLKISTLTDSSPTLTLPQRERGQTRRCATKTLMIQGTTSDAGKSTVVAGLCRVFKRRGVRVAPFKPQNMALNSAVTEDGGEIGRAQAVQAQAAGLAPHTDMNPVLLKPNSDTGAQVIIHGRAISNMEAVAYHDYKKVARAAVLESYGRLSAQYEMVMVEGAGSPAEINLRAGDIANMGFAEAVDCPVLIVADIDKGGVFAHLVGTLALLSDSEQARVKGFIINRFRGDIALLQPGLEWLQQRTGKPVLGVLPYLHGLHLEAEDAISHERKNSAPSHLNIVVPVLPHISNHTDFDPLRLHPQVDLHFVAAGETPPAADLIILPGSKNVRNDLQWLRTQGWDDHLARHLRYGGKLMAICGGLQMLGTVVHDPHGIEGTPGSSDGLGYLDYTTTLQPHKQLHNVRGKLARTHEPLCGYEIHAGVSEGQGLKYPFAQLDDGRSDGAISTDDNILATYLHGVFEMPESLAALLQWAGLRSPQVFDYHAVREQNLERLADTLEAHLDMPSVMQILGELQ